MIAFSQIVLYTISIRNYNSQYNVFFFNFKQLKTHFYPKSIFLLILKEILYFKKPEMKYKNLNRIQLHISISLLGRSVPSRTADSATGFS